MLHNVSGINFLVLSVNRIPVSLSLTCVFMLLSHLSYHIFSRCQLTTVTINNYPSLSFTPGSKPSSFTEFGAPLQISTGFVSWQR